MTCNASVLVVGSTNILAIGNPEDPTGDGGLYNALTNTPINDATCTVETIIDLHTKAVVTGWTLPAAMDYLVGSNGVYTVETPTALALVKGQQIKVTFKAAKSGKVTLLNKVFTATEENGV